MIEAEPNEPIAVETPAENVQAPTKVETEKKEAKEGEGTEGEDIIATDDLVSTSVGKTQSPPLEKVQPPSNYPPPEKVNPPTNCPPPEIVNPPTISQGPQEQDQNAAQSQEYKVDETRTRDNSQNQDSGGAGWSWFASGATDLLSTLKQEVSTVAVGVKKAVKNTVKEVREDIHEMSQDLKSMLLDESEVRKDSRKCEVAVKRLNLIDKRTSQLRLLVEDLVTFRSILSTKHKNLKSFLDKRRIGGQPIVDACLELSQSIEELDTRHSSQDNVFETNILTPLGIVRERVQISRDLYVQYNQKKNGFGEVAGQWRKSQLQSNASATELKGHQESFNNAIAALDTAENDFIESVKNLQKFVESSVADKFRDGAEELVSGEKSSNDGLDEADADLLNALEAESSEEDEQEVLEAGEEVVEAGEEVVEAKKSDEEKNDLVAA